MVSSSVKKHRGVLCTQPRRSLAVWARGRGGTRPAKTAALWVASATHNPNSAFIGNLPSKSYAYENAVKWGQSLIIIYKPPIQQRKLITHGKMSRKEYGKNETSLLHVYTLKVHPLPALLPVVVHFPLHLYIWLGHLENSLPALQCCTAAGIGCLFGNAQDIAAPAWNITEAFHIRLFRCGTAVSMNVK